jgi:DNA-damage-inducible protein J
VRAIIFSRRLKVIKTIKTAVVRARIDPKLKINAEKILHKLGITQTQYINIAFKKLTEENGIPFDLHTPNKDTLEAMKEVSESDSLPTYKKFDDFIDSLNN